MLVARIARFPVCLVVGLSLVGIAGCQDSTTSPTPAAPVTSPTAGSTTPAGTDAPKTASTDKSTEKPAAKPTFDGTADFAAAEQALKAEKADEAQAALKKLHAASKDLSDEQKKQLKELDEQLEQARSKAAEKQRDTLMTEAKAFFDEGDLEKAGQRLASLLANSPSDEQQEAARELQEQIEKHRSVRRKLRTGLELLETDNRGQVKEGQQILWEEPDVSLPLLLQSLKQNKPVLVRNVLEMMRKMNEPARTVPAMVGIISRVEQKDCWPAATKELHYIQHPGSGEPLLELALTTKDPEQFVAACDALGGIVDPPSQTLVALLPKLFGDEGPELEAALGAAYFSVQANDQFDLASRRGIDATLTAEQEEQLNQLPERLAKLIDAVPAGQPLTTLAIAAKRLAVATRQMEPQVLPGVKIVRATAEFPESPSAAVLDGVWNSTDVKTMWRHPPKALTTLMLDLGEERTVTAVKIWNGNEKALPLQAWKELEIYVSNSQSPTTPAARGTLPTSPCADATPDYGTTIPVPFTRGRYLKLQMMSSWGVNVPAGLAEIQVLGY